MRRLLDNLHDVAALLLLSPFIPVIVMMWVVAGLHRLWKTTLSKSSPIRTSAAVKRLRVRQILARSAAAS
jgi:hypothetical protein